MIRCRYDVLRGGEGGKDVRGEHGKEEPLVRNRWIAYGLTAVLIAAVAYIIIAGGHI